MSKNKLRTPSYFIKRLRDNGFIVIKLFAVYSKQDQRQWTLKVNQSETSVFITTYANKNHLDEILFEFNDGGRRIASNFFIKTDSIEVIIDFLLKNGVSNNTPYKGRERYFKKRLNNYDEKQEFIQQ